MPKSKNQSKFKRTLAWFKPTSAKKGALLFAIAFAVIGGSFMAYKSFAATGNEYQQLSSKNSVQGNEFLKLVVSKNEVHVATKGHCYVEYVDGTYLGVVYHKTRTRSTVEGRGCRVWQRVNGTLNGVSTSSSPYSYDWSSTTPSAWHQVKVGPTASFETGYSIITNLETNYWLELRTY